MVIEPAGPPANDLADDRAWHIRTTVNLSRLTRQPDDGPGISGYPTPPLPFSRWAFDVTLVWRQLFGPPSWQRRLTHSSRLLPPLVISPPPASIRHSAALLVIGPFVGRRLATAAVWHVAFLSCKSQYALNLRPVECLPVSRRSGLSVSLGAASRPSSPARLPPLRQQPLALCTAWESTTIVAVIFPCCPNGSAARRRLLLPPPPPLLLQIRRDRLLRAWRKLIKCRDKFDRLNCRRCRMDTRNEGRLLTALNLSVRLSLHILRACTADNAPDRP